MQITIEAIESKEFKWKSRGYDPEDVDNFLDDICDEMARQQDMIQKLQQQLKEARTVRPAEQVEAPKETAPAAASSDDVQQMLAMAVRLKNETLADAQKKAEEILAKAEEQAKDRLGNLATEHDRLTAQVATLKQAAAEYREKFTALLKDQQELLESAEELF